MRKVFLLFALLLFSVNVVCAANLDQPMDKPITLKTEIQRGSSSVSSIKPLRTLPFSNDVSSIIEYNKQKNTDTEGFYLGTYFRAWLKMDMLISHKLYNNIDELNLANNSVLLYYNEFRKLQLKYEINDKTLCDITGLNYEYIKPYFDKWYAQTHNSE